MNHTSEGLVKRQGMLRASRNAHRFLYFVNGRLKTFTTHADDVLCQLAALFGQLNQVRPKTAFLGGLVAAVLSGSAYALPDGYQSVAGDVQFSQNGSVLNVSTGAQRSIANYRSFSIDGHETVNFNLPSSSAAILNRVTGGDASRIMGALNSNGNVYLVNPNGILFGANAQVNVGSLTASTLGISNQDFLNGRLIFNRDSAVPGASVVNQGLIRVNNGGAVSLFGAAVSNSGQIIAPQGQVHLAVGDQISMQIDNNILMDVKVDRALQNKVQDVRSAVSNLGSIQANAGLVELQAKVQGALYDNLVNNEGIIKAGSVAEHNGQIVLLAENDLGTGKLVNTGIVDASGTTGAANAGNVLLQADLVEQAGQVLAEGAEGGRGGDVRIASKVETNLASGSVTSVRGAAENSSAGRLVVWSDGDTHFQQDAKIDVSGGNTSGDGGFVEVSAKNTVFFEGQAKGSANNGQAGTILIDPTTILLTAAGAAGTPNVPVTDPNNAGGQSIFNVASFAGFSSVNLEASSDITVNSPFLLPLVSGVGTLNLSAGNNININAPVTTGGGAVFLTADASLTGSPSNGLGAVQFNAGGPMTGSLLSNGGNITIQGPTVKLAGAVNAGTGDVMISSSVSDVTHTTGMIQGANVTINSASDYRQSAPASITATNGVNITAVNTINQAEGGMITGPNVTLQATNGTIGGTGANNLLELDASQLTVTGTNVARINDVSGGVQLNNVTTTGAFRLNTLGTGQLTLNGVLNSGGTVTLATEDGSIVQNTGSAISAFNGLTLTANKTGMGPVNFLQQAGSSLTGRDVTVTAADNIQLSGNTTGGSGFLDLVQFNALAGDFTHSAGLIQGANIHADAGQNVMLSSGIDGANILGNSVFLTANDGNLTQLAGNIDGRNVALTAKSLDPTKGNVIQNAGASITGNEILLTADNDVTVSGTIDGGPLFGNFVTLTAKDGNVTVNGGPGNFIDGFDVNLLATDTGTIDKMADGNVFVNGGTPITGTNATIQADYNVTLTGNVDTGNDLGNFAMIQAKNGNITQTGGIIDGRNVTLLATAGDPGTGNYIQSAGAGISGTVSTVQASELADLNGSIVVDKDSTVTGRNINANGTINTGLSSTLMATGGNLIHTGSTTAGTNSTMIATNLLSVAGTAASGQSTLLQSTAGTATVSGAVTAGQDATLTAPMDVSVSGSLAAGGTALLQGSNVNVTGTVSGATAQLNATQNINTSGAINGTNAVMMMAMFGNINQTGGAITGGGATLTALSSDLGAGQFLQSGNGIIQTASLDLTTQRGVNLSGQGTQITGNANVTANTGDIVGTGIFGAGSLNLLATTGNIGTSFANRVMTQANNLTANTPLGSTYINQQGALNLNASNSLNDFFLNVTTPGNLVVNGNVLSTTGLFQTTGGGDVLLNANLEGTQDLQVHSYGSGGISGPGQLRGTNLYMTAEAGSINVNTNVSNLIAGSFGNTAINEANSVNLVMGNAAGTFNLTTGNVEPGIYDPVGGGTIMSSGLVSGRRVNLNAFGNILDGNGSDTNLQSSGGNSSLVAGGFIGTLDDPFDVNVRNGRLMVQTFGQNGNFSAVLAGRIQPSNRVAVLRPTPGRVLFNGALQGNGSDAGDEMNRNGYPFVTQMANNLINPIFINNREVTGELTTRDGKKVDVTIINNIREEQPFDLRLIEESQTGAEEGPFDLRLIDVNAGK